MWSAVRLSLLCVCLGAACKEFPNPFAEKKSSATALQYTYSINFAARGNAARPSTQKGGVGQLHLSTSPVKDGIEVRSKINTDIDIALGAGGKIHKLNQDYEALPPVYNIFTLPLRLRQLARLHKQVLTDTHALLQKISELERQLLTAGKSVYAAFATLPVVNSGNYVFSGLKQHSRVSFAGKHFTADLAAVRKEIDARTAALKQSVSYRQDTLRAATKVDFDSAVLYEQAAVISHPSRERTSQPFAPSFRAKGKSDAKRGEVFKEIVTHLSTLKQAKLLLAKTLLRLYAPRYFTYQFNVLGYREKLTVAATADDTHRHRQGHQIVFSYQLRASSPQQGNFHFGQCAFDRVARPLLIRTSLKPVGKGYLDLMLQ